MTLPQAVATTGGDGVRLRTVDLATVEANPGPAPGSGPNAGIITLTLDPVDPGYYWRVERIVVQCNSAASTTCTVYAGNIIRPLGMRDLTLSGNAAVAEYPTGLLILPSTSLQLQWTGASAGATAYASVQYQLVQRVG